MAASTASSARASHASGSPAAVTPPPGTRRRRRSLQRRRQLLGVAFVAPAVVMVSVFFLAPLVGTFWISLSDWPLLGSHSFIGFGNYSRAFSDATFRSAVLFTLKYTVLITPVLFVLGLALAALVRRPTRGAPFFRAVYIAPVVVGFASAAYLWLFMAQPGLGPLTDAAARLGLSAHDANWFSTPDKALLVVIAMVTWKVVGQQMILLLSGLQAVPVEVEEAARVDGANRWQTFVHVVLPLLRPTLALVLVFSVAGSLLAFDQFYIMTHGGPSNGTITAVYQIYRTSFTGFALGAGAAQSVLLMVVLAAVSAVQLLLLRNTDDA